MRQTVRQTAYATPISQKVVVYILILIVHKFVLAIHTSDDFHDRASKCLVGLHMNGINYIII
jgi:hypothetical protein